MHLGGTRSLLAPMEVKSIRSANPWTHTGPILRISVGLEDPEELWADLERIMMICDRVELEEVALTRHQVGALAARILDQQQVGAPSAA